MKRFAFFPIALGFAGALCIVLFWLESTAAQWTILTGVDIYWHPQNLLKAFAAQMGGAAALGIVVGIIFALWDKVRNQHLLATQNLLPNLFWCLLYASSINAINCLISNFALGFVRGSSKYYPLQTTYLQ